MLAALTKRGSFLLLAIGCSRPGHSHAEAPRASYASPSDSSAEGAGTRQCEAARRERNGKGLTPREISCVVMPAHARFRTCYELSSAKETPGIVTVTFSVNPKGEVFEASVTRDDIA